jgi:hypothetical protein
MTINDGSTTIHIEEIAKLLKKSASTGAAPFISFDVKIEMADSKMKGVFSVNGRKIFEAYEGSVKPANDKLGFYYERLVVEGSEDRGNSEKAYYCSRSSKRAAISKNNISFNRRRIKSSGSKKASKASAFILISSNKERSRAQISQINYCRIKIVKAIRQSS